MIQRKENNWNVQAFHIHFFFAFITTTLWGSHCYASLFIQGHCSEAPLFFNRSWEWVPCIALTTSPAQKTCPPLTRARKELVDLDTLSTSPDFLTSRDRVWREPQTPTHLWPLSFWLHYLLTVWSLSQLISFPSLSHRMFTTYKALTPQTLPSSVPFLGQLLRSLLISLWVLTGDPLTLLPFHSCGFAHTIG